MCSPSMFTYRDAVAILRKAGRIRGTDGASCKPFFFSSRRRSRMDIHLSSLVCGGGVGGARVSSLSGLGRLPAAAAAAKATKASAAGHACVQRSVVVVAAAAKSAEAGEASRIGATAARRRRETVKSFLLYGTDLTQTSYSLSVSLCCRNCLNPRKTDNC